MKRSTLIHDLAIRYKYLNHEQVERMVELVFKHLASALAEDKRIEIRSMGTWHVKTRGARNARNPRTGEKVQVGIKKNILIFQILGIKRFEHFCRYHFVSCIRCG